MKSVGSQKHRRDDTKAPDRLLSPEVSALESEIHFMCAPLDRATKQMDLTWGQDQLPGLVAIETAGKYGFAIGTLNQAISDRDKDNVKKWVAVCIRGLKAMDEEARAAGHTPITGKYIEVQIEAHDEMEAMGFGILLDPAHRAAAQAQRPDLTMITPREAALGYRVKLHVPLVQAVKEHFPAAHITKVKPKTPVDYAAGGDEIPF